LKPITISTENAEFQIVQSLKLNRTKRAGLGEIFIEGIESIKQALRAKLEITRIIITSAKNLSQWGQDIIRSNPAARVLELSRPLYEALCDRAEPSEMLVTAKQRPLTLGELGWVPSGGAATPVVPARPFLSANPFFLLFDRPSDTGNLGSVIRSFNSFGGDALFILGHGVDIYDPKVIRASLGSVFFTPIIPLQSNEELNSFIADQKTRNNLKVWGTDSTGTVSLTSAPLDRPLLLIIGNEAKGISVALKQLCDGIVSIPLLGEVNSLNVASAASIFMWEVFRHGKKDVATVEG
jgi:TrmH family RNA methyltransferase